MENKLKIKMKCYLSFFYWENTQLPKKDKEKRKRKKHINRVEINK